jgi:hypothetical protein
LKAGSTYSAKRSLIGSSDHTPDIPAQALMLYLSLANLSAADKAM